MKLRANTEKKFLFKYLAIGLACLAFALWAAYDGFVKYPGQMPRAVAYENLILKIEADENLGDSDIKKMWTPIAEENGWSAKKLKTDEYPKAIEGKIKYQYLFMGIGLLFGIPCLLWYFKTKGTWIEATGDGIRSSKGEEVKINEIVSFDKQKWEKKGIGVIHYKSGGEEKKFVIDDLKYERKPTDEIVDWMESQLSRDIIVNGITEAEFKDKQKADGKDKPKYETN